MYCFIQKKRKFQNHGYGQSIFCQTIHHLPAILSEILKGPFSLMFKTYFQ